MKKNVFISYSSKESTTAYMIRDVLEKNGIRCWMAPESIAPGSNYMIEIPRGIGECDVFLLLLSDNAQASNWVINELEKAVSIGKVIIPFMISKCAITEPFAFALARAQRLDAYQSMSDNLEKLVKQIKRIMGGAEEENGTVFGLQNGAWITTSTKSRSVKTILSKKGLLAIVGTLFVLLIGIGVVPKILKSSDARDEGKDLGAISNIGQETVVIPACENKSEIEIRSKLSKLGIEAKFEEEYSDDVKKGDIIRQSISDGTVVEKGTRLQIVVSKGKKDDVAPTNTPTPHYHDYEYNVEVVDEANCTDNGQKKHSCSCGDNIVETIYAYDHSFDMYYSDGNADCTKDGTKSSKCSNPGCNVTDTKIDAGSRTRKHTYSCDCDVICEVCGAYRESIVEHSYVISDIRNEGDTVIIENQCKNCGYTMAESIFSPVEEEMGLGEGEVMLGGEGGPDDIGLGIGGDEVNSCDCHEYGSDCDEICDICNEKRSPLEEHSYVDVSAGNGDDGFGIRTWECKNCGDLYDEFYFWGS